MKALVLGAGIVGVTTAYELNRRGYAVTVIDREAIEAVAEEARTMGVKAIALLADVSDDAAVSDMVAAAQKEFGADQFDIVVRNARGKVTVAFTRGIGTSDREAVMQAMDQIINSAAKTRYMSGGQMGCSIVFRGPNGAAARVAAQHSQDYTAWYSHIPGVKVIAPSNAADAKGLLKAAIRDPNPVIFLEHEIVYGRSFEVPKIDDFVLPIGQAKVERPGKDVTIFAFSIMVGKAMKAAEELAAAGHLPKVRELTGRNPSTL